MTHTEETAFLRRVKDTVLAVDPRAEVWLFGSRARGDARPDSDWDFLILTEQPAEPTLRYELSDKLLDVEMDTAQALGLLVRQKDEWEDLEVTDIYQNVKDDGRRL